MKRAGLLSILVLQLLCLGSSRADYYIVNYGSEWTSGTIDDGTYNSNGVPGNIEIQVPLQFYSTPRFRINIHKTDGTTLLQTATYGVSQAGTTSSGGSYVFVSTGSPQTSSSIPVYEVYIVSDSSGLPFGPPEEEGGSASLPPVINLPRLPPDMPPYIIEDPDQPIPVPPEYNPPPYVIVIPQLPDQPTDPVDPGYPVNPVVPGDPTNPAPPVYNPPDNPGTDPGGGSGSGGSGGDVSIMGIASDVYDQLEYRERKANLEALQQRELSSGEIALKIHDVLKTQGLSDENIEVRVQQALNAQGMSSYQIGIAVKDALYSQNLNDAAIGRAVEWGMGQRHLSAEEIAGEIQQALEALGLDTTGMYGTLRAALSDQDLSAGNFEMAFESALMDTGNNPEGMEIAMENALAYRNLSAAEIGQEVGNQMQGLGLSTVENDNLVRDAIVSAIEAIPGSTNDFGPVVFAVEGLGSALTNSGGFTVNDDLADMQTNFLDTATAANSVSNRVNQMTEGFGHWFGGISKPILADPGKVKGIDLQTGRFGSVEISWDYPGVELIRNMFRWLVYIMFFFACVMIVRRGIA